MDRHGEYPHPKQIAGNEVRWRDLTGSRGLV